MRLLRYLQKPMTTLLSNKQNIAHCQSLHRLHGVSYYFATTFFPKKMREDTYVVYAFFRIPDEYVDNTTNKNEAAQKLQQWSQAWHEAYTTKNSTDPVLQETARVFYEYNIPFTYSEAFLKAMEMDLSKTRYMNYPELQEYMYGSAAAVGLIMSHIIGFSAPTALAYAEKLGYAMQLTNFIRDIGEDYQKRGRIYIPLDECARFGVTEDMIARGQVTPELNSLLQFQIARAQQLYSESRAGIALLNKPGRLPVKIATTLYSAILHKIAQNKYDVFTKRASTSTKEKISLSLKTLFSREAVI